MNARGGTGAFGVALEESNGEGPQHITLSHWRVSVREYDDGDDDNEYDDVYVCVIPVIHWIMVCILLSQGNCSGPPGL